MSKFKKFIPFIKVDDGKRQVWGVVTAEVPDKDEEVCDYGKSKPYYKAVIDEFSKATDGQNFFPLREMHQLSAVGKCVGFEFRDSDKEIYMGFEVVDDDAWKKVQKRVYTGFSQGGSVVGDMKPDPVFKGCMRYTADPSEVSLVDNPCLGVAHFAHVKSDGSVDLQKLRSEPLTKEAKKDEGGSSKKMNKVSKEVSEKRKALIHDFVRKHARVWVNKHINNKSKLKKTSEKSLDSLLMLDNDLGLLFKGKREVAKGMREVSCLASCLENFCYLFWMVCNEQQWEEDDASELPSMLADNITGMVDSLLAMVGEETDELKEVVAERLAATEAAVAAS